MSRIRILPEAVANKIAAGEVVERPASVVKELLENALDAGANTIRIEVEVGGKRMIRVIDDGHGMTHDDALLAFERHATSKLRSADDLLSISTLGFRGEALPTIAAVSRLLLETRDETEAEGTRVEFAGGKLINVKPAGLPAGTTVSVADIFYCVPARRKFLKSDTTELGHIASLVTHYALANPAKQFLLTTPTQEIINCPPAEKLADRIYQLFGRQSLEELVEIPAASAAFRAAITEPELEAEEEKSSLTVSGFTSRPDVQRLNRNGIYIFVNRRLVRDRLILHAIHEAYRNILPPAVFPATLLFLEMPYDEVDVNVHPAKIEVRFRRSEFVHNFTRDTIRQALMGTRPIASFATAAGASPPTIGSGNGGLSGGIMPPPAESGVPRAIIPPMEEIGLGSGVGSDGGFDLTSAPMQPVEQRIPFTSGVGFGAGVAPARISDAVNWAANLAALSADGPATRANRRSQTPRPGQRELHHRRERRGTLDRGPACGPRARALRTTPRSASRRKDRSAAHAHAPGDRAFAPANRHLRENRGRTGREWFRSRADGAEERGDSGRARRCDRSGCGEIAHRNSRWPGPRKRGDFHRNFAGENRSLDRVPRGDQDQHAARTVENGMAARCPGQNRLPDELPARTPGGFAIFHQGN